MSETGTAQQRDEGGAPALEKDENDEDHEHECFERV